VIRRFLVTLGDCHYLDGLVDCDLHCEAHVVIMRCSGEELCEGYCAQPTGAVKSNSSRRDVKGDKWYS
jgi:hypothetical protein